MENFDWYQTLIKPQFAPPDWVFAPAWAILYFTIALSLMFFLKTGVSKGKILPLSVFCVQLLLNFIWSPVFFGFKNIKLALIIIGILWIGILFTIISFHKYSKISAYLLIPYLLWVTFAVYLNYGFWVLN